MTREIRRLLRNPVTVDNVLRAIQIGSAAIDEDVPEAALDILRWAKERVPRSPTVREILGVALYRAEDYGAAASELAAYRRMTGSDDQNHVLADARRAQGHELERYVGLLEAELGDDRVPADRKVEALLVWAGAKLDQGDRDGSTALVRSADRWFQRSSLAPAAAERLAAFQRALDASS